MARKHKEDEVLKSLRQKHDVKITDDKQVLILNGKSSNPKFHVKSDLGNGSWGKIDFLVNHCGYIKFFVKEF